MATQQKQGEEQAFSTVIRERRSVRAYDPNFKISREEINELLGEAILAPSSSNLQPWRFLVIDSEELKQQLLPIAFNQQQVVEASAVIAVLGDMESYKLTETIFGRAVEAGFMPADTAKAFVERSVGMYSSLPSEVRTKIVATDGGLVSMQLMLAARARGWDTVPMGGYDASKFKETFGVSERYLPIMLIAVGKAAKPGHPTIRLAVDEVTSYNVMSN
ncbi:nitroreductase family protein [Paenibacillus sacheonensis]|uniref:Nitroreductase family protein n=1 Tax=Paenibacillus sacheonensis TaxID=742054 RepID=A0A7X4YUZ7_9BACL|nr:nitroreductase family protein [Paenibacillus sacheonensis]MBM7566556.1 nitroreductase [Paenibacillus sacheonensis]NBC73057.1 nitroreductase family protein [Paenibacillus sacheonensis]